MLINGMMVVLILTNLLLLGTSRLGGCIRIVALQGILLGFLPLITYEDILSLHIFFIAVGSLVVKGIVFPKLLTRASREAESRHEMEPFIGYSLSLILGVIALGFSFWMRTQLPALGGQVSALVLPVFVLYHYNRALIDHRTPQSVNPGVGVSGDGKRHLCFWCGIGERPAASCGTRGSVGCIHGGFCHGCNVVPYQP